MIKKLGNKGLLIILVVLLAVFGIARFISNKTGENTFKTSIIPQIDSNKLTGMVIFQKATKKGKPLPFIFTRKGNEWYVSQGNIGGRAAKRSVQYMVSQLEDISPNRLGAEDPKDWKQFCVNDSLGTRVVLLYNKDTALDVIVGRFSYLPQERKGLSYVRLAGQDKVYAVDGFLALNITEEFDAWRDKKITPGDSYETWKKLTFTYPGDSGFEVKKDSANEWIMDNHEKTDSLAAINAIRTISEQNYAAFVNNFDSSGKQPVFKVRIEGSDFSPVVIKAWPADTANKYAINSTLNPGSFFSGSKAGVAGKIFPGKEDFFRKEETPKQPKASAHKAKSKR